MLCLALLLPPALAGCAEDPVAVPVPDLPHQDTAACRGLLEDLPTEIGEQSRRPVAGGEGRAAAWGDPAIVLRCGVPQPPGFTDTSTCIEANGTGWYVPDEVLLADDETRDVTMTAVGVRPRVEVFVPGEYRPEGFTDAAGRVGSVIAERLEQVQPCR